MSNLKKYQNLGDFHTHTIFSFHGMSSPTEMVEAAMDKGLKYIALTDHYYPFQAEYGRISGRSEEVFLNNQISRLWEIKRSFEPLSDKITVIPGFEHNVFSKASETFNTDVDCLNLIGLHNWFYWPGENFSTFKNSIEKAFSTGRFKIMAHLEREAYNLTDLGWSHFIKFMTEVIDICNDHHIVLEVNNSSIDDLFGADTACAMMSWLKYARDSKCHIIINSDAHVKYNVGNIDAAVEVLNAVNYPADLIINFDEDKIKTFVLNK